MTTVRIGTFNCENLFQRFRFKGKKTTKTVGGKKTTTYVPYTPTELADAVANGFVLDTDKFERVRPAERLLTAKAIKAVDADILGLMEVENLDTLKTFLRDASLFSGKKKYPFMYVIDGNDPRLIDVGIASKLPVTSLRTHQFARSGNAWTFSRDCLEATFDVGGKPLTVFVNHLKSMLGGRAETKARRKLQSGALLEILKQRFGKKFGDADFVLLGDLNDYMEPGDESASGIRELLESNQMENVVARLPAAERWTHFYDGDGTVHQLDYLLVSRALAARNPGVLPVIERRGMPKKVNRKGQPPRVGAFFDDDKASAASDHCPVAIDLKV